LRFSELWHSSQKVYKEISFQSIFSFRSGGILPQRGRGSVEQLVKNAQINTLISKLLTTVFVAVFGFTIFLPFRFGSSSAVPPEVVFAGGVSAFLAVVLSLITVMGLQVSTSFVSSKILEVLGPLPLSRSDISSILFLCLVRIFDIPLAGSVVILLAAYAIAGGTLIGGVVALVGIIATEIFALALTIGLARFFYSRVTGGGGRSRWKGILRIIFMLVWILPSFGTYFVINFATQIAQSFASTAGVLTSASQLLLLVYPFCFGSLVSFANFSKVNTFPLLLALCSSIGYSILAYSAFRWVIRSVRKLGTGGVITKTREIVKDTSVSPQAPWLGIIRKDLRVASRAPSYASLFLLPPLETAILGISFSSVGDIGFSASLGILVGVSLVTLVLPPTLLSIEGLASSYTRSLPLKKRTAIAAKAVLSMLMYTSSLLILILITLYLQRGIIIILTFGSIQMLSVAAASLLELVISARKFWKEGFAIGNIYARLSTYIAIIVPGLILALVPVVAAVAAFVYANSLTPWIYLGVALAEFVLMLLVASRE
jgi:hypothetical protein